MTKKLEWVEERGEIILVLDSLIWFEIAKTDLPNGRYMLFRNGKYSTTYATVQECKDYVEIYSKRLYNELQQYFGGVE